VTIVVDDQGTEITVEDSGPGVPAPLRERILEEGFSTKAEQQGVVRGVGLSLVAAVVQRRAGELHVDGSGRGAVFTVTLPRRTAPLPAGEARR
jgi:two-component system CitB family sensor kinase